MHFLSRGDDAWWTPGTTGVGRTCNRIEWRHSGNNNSRIEDSWKGFVKIAAIPRDVCTVSYKFSMALRILFSLVVLSGANKNVWLKLFNVSRYWISPCKDLSIDIGDFSRCSEMSRLMLVSNPWPLLSASRHRAHWARLPKNFHRSNWVVVAQLFKSIYWCPCLDVY